VFLTGLKRQTAFTSPPAVITNLITQEKLIQLLNTAKSKRKTRINNKTTTNKNTSLSNSPPLAQYNGE
jgi:hypothetical protein